MKVVHTINDLAEALRNVRKEHKTVGLVPTMGALHKGHESLVKKCVSENDVAVVSVFVNPTQFNNPNDLKCYPRTFDADSKLLEANGVAFVFAPTSEEVYPEVDTRVFNYAPLDTVMEGQFRPGHFNGVCQIVSKLFEFVNPDRAYFGEKDFQQLAIIRRMAKDLFPSLQVVGCPIVREADGLALSSRNMLLSEEQRVVALNISKILFESVKYADNHNLAETYRFVVDGIANAEGLELEYFEIVDGLTLQNITDWDDTAYSVGCITVYCGSVRLIDNITYRK